MTTPLKPLSGVRVVEFHARGPVPFCTMLLTALGAEVQQVLRPGDATSDPHLRYVDIGKQAVVLDLKSSADRDRALELTRQADVVVEGMRPGAMERLALGPTDCMPSNAGLIYARISGWGQVGARAQEPGHDINYLAATGLLGMIGPRDGLPVPPLNLLADYAGGSLFAAYGICAALFDRQRHGRGCVVDAAMADGVLALMIPLFSMLARNQWQGERGENMLDGGAPWYGVYRTSDHRHLAVGAMEMPFRRAFFDGLELPSHYAALSETPSEWKSIRMEVERVIGQRDLAHWREVFRSKEACVTPVASLDEVQRDAEFIRRGSLAMDPLAHSIRPQVLPLVHAATSAKTDPAAGPN